MDYTGLPASTIKRASSTKRRSPSADRKRQLIIESAERIFATRGFHDTTIADISNDSGVHEASIFQYFKTKENLIVTVPERHLKETLAGITEHLQGMKGAEPKLRKLMWHQLRDLTINRGLYVYSLAEPPDPACLLQVACLRNDTKIQRIHVGGDSRGGP